MLLFDYSFIKYIIKRKINILNYDIIIQLFFYKIYYY